MAVWYARSVLYIEPQVRLGSRGMAVRLVSCTASYTFVPSLTQIQRPPPRRQQVLAGALKDNGRGVVVGESTFGKGLIQTVVDLSDGSGLAVTVAKYQTPAGGWGSSGRGEQSSRGKGGGREGVHVQEVGGRGRRSSWPSTGIRRRQVRGSGGERRAAARGAAEA